MVSSVDSITDYYLNSVVGLRVQSDITAQLAALANNSSLLVGNILYSKDNDGNLTAASLPSSTVYDPLYNQTNDRTVLSTGSPSTVGVRPPVTPLLKSVNPSSEDSILEIQPQQSIRPTSTSVVASQPSTQLDLFIQDQTTVSSLKTTPQALPLASFSFIENRNLAAQNSGFELELSPETTQAIQHLTEAQLLATSYIQTYLSTRNPFAASWITSNRPSLFLVNEDTNLVNVDVSTDANSGGNGSSYFGLGLQMSLSQGGEDSSEDNPTSRQSLQRARQLNP